MSAASTFIMESELPRAVARTVDAAHLRPFLQPLRR
jgi:hypothetical protein